jgi:hypothetical protein
MTSTKWEQDSPGLLDGVRAVIRVKVEPGSRKFGLIAMGEVVPTWMWFIGSEGVCMWTVADKARVRRETAQDAVKWEEASKVNWLLLPLVDAVLVKGMSSPSLDHPVWTLNGVEVIVWCNHRTRGGRRFVPEGWSF